MSSRLWNRDLSLWQATDADSELGNRLGWLDVFDWLPDAVPELTEWAANIATGNRFRHVVVLGMGGSSLAPLVFSELFGTRAGYPELTVLDSTAPEMVSAVVELGVIDTLFVVSSKSGTTLETMDLYRFFYKVVAETSQRPGDHFIAITDPGSWLEQHAGDTGFARVFLNPETIGGRYSALSYFGLVPAALAGVDVETVVARGAALARATRGENGTHPEQLGAAMGERALAGQDKMMLALPPSLHSLGVWIEQLVAESTGKNGKGILPVCVDPGAEPLATADSFEVAISDQAVDDATTLSWSVTDPLDIGAEFFRWEFATAIAASKLAVNPFDQPNVAEAKTSTARFTRGDGVLPPLHRIATGRYDLLTTNAKRGESLPEKPEPGSYIAVLAFLPVTTELTTALQGFRALLATRFGVQVTTGFGPRYLHSTGQLHKGGRQNGTFILFSSHPDSTTDIVNYSIPGRDYSFAKLIEAQADGDTSVLVERARPVMRVQLKGDRLKAIQAFSDALTGAVT